MTNQNPTYTSREFSPGMPSPPETALALRGLWPVSTLRRRPTVWTFTRNRRARFVQGNTLSALQSISRNLAGLSQFTNVDPATQDVPHSDRLLGGDADVRLAMGRALGVLQFVPGLRSSNRIDNYGRRCARTHCRLEPSPSDPPIGWSRTNRRLAKTTPLLALQSLSRPP